MSMLSDCAFYTVNQGSLCDSLFRIKLQQPTQEYLGPILDCPKFREMYPAILFERGYQKRWSPRSQNQFAKRKSPELTSIRFVFSNVIFLAKRKHGGQIPDFLSSRPPGLYSWDRLCECHQVPLAPPGSGSPRPVVRPLGGVWWRSLSSWLMPVPGQNPQCTCDCGFFNSKHQGYTDTSRFGWMCLGLRVYDICLRQIYAFNL